MFKLLVESFNHSINDHIKEFCTFACENLGLPNIPSITFVNKTGQSSFGNYKPHDNTITVATEGRHIADILRTLCHEIIHAAQMYHESNATVPELEYEANAIAGMLMRDYNKAHPELYGIERNREEDPDEEGESDSSISQGVPTNPPYPTEIAETPINAVGTGAYAGLGIGPYGEPGINPEDAIDAEADDTDWNSQPGHHHKNREKRPVIIQQHQQTADRNMTITQWKQFHYNQHLQEDGAVAINNAGSGHIAGIGVGPQGEPGVNTKKKKTPILMNIQRRKLTLQQFKESIQS